MARSDATISALPGAQTSRTSGPWATAMDTTHPMVAATAARAAHSALTARPGPWQVERHERVHDLRRG